MGTKYYTPELHEFHEGFEYEDGFTHAEFCPRRFSYNEAARMDRSLFLKALDNKLIRVKCLDKEDIESFGWIYDDVMRDGGTLIFKKGDIELHYARENKLRPSSVIKIIGKFIGKIKNKSEFLKLMSQLNIQ